MSNNSLNHQTNINQDTFEIYSIAYGIEDIYNYTSHNCIITNTSKIIVFGKLLLQFFYHMSHHSYLSCYFT
jgi:hypothetical protein